MQDLPPARSRRAAPGVARFTLYGEAPASEPPPLHVEEVQARSRHHQWEIAPHVHAGLLQMVWVVAGAAQVHLDAHGVALGAHSGVLIPAGVVHGFRFAPDTQGFVLTLSAGFLAHPELTPIAQDWLSSAAQPCVLARADAACAPPAVGRIEALLGQLLNEFLQAQSANAPTAAWLARAVLWHAAQLQPPKGLARATRWTHQQALFNRFLALIEQQHLAHWPLARYADALGVSLAALNRLARAARGCSALELVHERLTREACRRLIYLAAPASRLALELGFEDSAYFARFVRRRTGLSPQAYRQRARSALAGASAQGAVGDAAADPVSASAAPSVAT